MTRAGTVQLSGTAVGRKDGMSSRSLTGQIHGLSTPGGVLELVCSRAGLLTLLAVLW